MDISNDNDTTFGPKERSQLQAISPERLYVLQLGAFEQEHNATRYKAYVERVTQQPLYKHLTL